MNAQLKVQRHHLERGAYLYIRQSSMRQVVENAESAKRQYALRGRAVALGWRDEQIIVIDNDQGESGASAIWREGFQRLVSDVGLGRAGIVMGLEVSRLARNNADWQRLLEICALADTLILDEDGVYDPASFNDRLLLGLKGTMSEAELHVIKARLRGGILNKAKRGEFRCPLPTGLVYDLSGNVALDPDLQVRETIAHFFETFSRVGSASQTVKTFRKEGLLFPSRLHNSETVFRPLTASTAMRVLTNPRYAGAYAYGRRQFRRTIEGKKTVRSRGNDDWLACIPNAHPGYISWEQHQENLKILKANGHGYDAARTSIPREGPALLQGRAFCGRCGGQFRVRYADRRGRQDAWYVCDRPHIYRGEPSCQSIAGPPVDQAIGMLIAEEMTPLAVELALEVRSEIQARHEEADRLRCRAIERAQTDADLAQRRFMLVDPNNRLVADMLEGEWNDRLRILANAREERQRAQRPRSIRSGRSRPRAAHRDDGGFQEALGRSRYPKPRTQAAARPRHRRRHPRQATGGRNHQGSCSVQRRQDPDAHHREPKILRPAGQDTARYHRIDRQAARRPPLCRDRRTSSTSKDIARRGRAPRAAQTPASPPNAWPISFTNTN